MEKEMQLLIEEKEKNSGPSSTIFYSQLLEKHDDHKEFMQV